MPRRELGAFIADAVASCEIVIRHAEGVTTEQYAVDVTRRAVVEHHFMIIGEALNQASRLQPDIKARITSFAGIVAFRNMIVHGYFLIDPATVLAIARDDVPVLLQELRSLDALPPPPNPAAE